MLEVSFIKDKETKNAIRFSEIVAEGRERGVVGSIYVLKTDLEKIGNPAKIKITVDKA